MLKRALGLAPLLGALVGLAADLLLAAAFRRDLAASASRYPPHLQAEAARRWIPALHVFLVVFVGYGALAGTAVRTLRRREPGQRVVRLPRCWRSGGTAPHPGGPHAAGTAVAPLAGLF
jgi:hypothetical protein